MGQAYTVGINQKAEAIYNLAQANKALADSVPAKAVVAAFGGDQTPAKATPAAKVKEEEKKATEEFSQAYENRYQKALDLQKSFKDNKRFIVSGEIADEKAADDERLANARLYYANQIALAEEERNAKIQFTQDIGNALGALADLIGKQTAAGKVLAIAQAVINTWLGVTEILRTKSVLPEPLATISRIANVAAVVATGLNAIKNIGKAQVPGAAGSAGGSSTSAPLQPSAPSATSTVLNQQQLNQIGNATVRAYVTETDVSTNQERIRRLNRAARI